MEVTEIFFWIIFSIVGLLIVVNYLRDINEYSPIIADFYRLDLVQTLHCHIAVRLLRNDSRINDSRLASRRELRSSNL